MKKHRIILIEDELTLGEIIKDSLEARGFDVTHYISGEEGLRAFLQNKPEIAILDVMLKDADGFAIAKSIRQTNKETPLLFLTAKSLPQDVVEGFESGGNDYLKKPFGLEELVVRIKVLLSKDRLLTSEEVKDDFVSIGDYSFHSTKQILQYFEETIKLSSRESELLKLLFYSKNQVLERKTILLKLWHDDHMFNSRSLDVYITRLRKYFSKDPQVQIINYRGIGYKLIT